MNNVQQGRFRGLPNYRSAMPLIKCGRRLGVYDLDGAWRCARRGLGACERTEALWKMHDPHWPALGGGVWLVSNGRGRGGGGVRRGHDTRSWRWGSHTTPPRTYLCFGAILASSAGPSPCFHHYRRLVRATPRHNSLSVQLRACMGVCACVGGEGGGGG